MGMVIGVTAAVGAILCAVALVVVGVVYAQTLIAAYGLVAVGVGAFVGCAVCLLVAFIAFMATMSN